MIKKLTRLLVVVCAVSLPTSLWAMTITEKTKGMTAQKGYFTTYWDQKSGQLYVQVDKLGDEFIYNTGLPGGLGSNDIGLDRGQVGDSLLVKFERHGNKIFLHQINLKFRAISDNPQERKAVRDAFAPSILGGFTVEAEEQGRVLINFTDHLISDQHGIADTIARTKQGSFSVDKARSAVYLPRTKSFPKNTEFEAILTLKSAKPGRYVRDVSANGKAITLRQHISFVKLPEPGYKVRDYHVNSGYFDGRYVDYAVPIEENITRRYITRHRLEKKTPGAAMSEAVEPIIYYLDPGAPEPIRGALLEGARWWNQAFEAAGYKDAFQVKMLPDGADPMDVRYNIINWVHRKTRGWSYGWRVEDPRTGEILKGHVTLGSLRVRQDFLIATALLSPYKTANSDITGLKEMALARIRQLSAHEVGHTIGLAHNFTTSSVGRESVMDYPHPLIKIKPDGTLDISDAYDVGIGDWDKYSIQYGYGEFDTGVNEKRALQGIIDEAFAKGLSFISDPDSRSLKDAHAGSHLWDSGADPTEELERLYRVRQIALDNFSAEAIKPEMPLSSLEEVLVPLYYLHRFQIEASGKVLGGLDYRYQLRQDQVEEGYQIVSPDRQRHALDTILKSVEPRFLALPERILKLLPPKAYGYERTRESFPRHTGKTFDAMALAEASASHAMTILLHPERAQRLVEFHARDKAQTSLMGYMDHIVAKVLKGKKASGLEGALDRRVGHVLVHHLMLLAQNNKASADVRAMAHSTLSDLEGWLRKQSKKASAGDLYKAHYRYQADRVAQYLTGDLKVSAGDLAVLPPGSPI